MFLLKFLIFFQSAFAVWYGETALEPEFSSVVQLQGHSEKCSAVVMNENTLLTAGHCAEFFSSDRSIAIIYTNSQGYDLQYEFSASFHFVKNYVLPTSVEQVAFDLVLVKTQESLLSRFKDIKFAKIYNNPIAPLEPLLQNNTVTAVGYGGSARLRSKKLSRTKMNVAVSSAKGGVVAVSQGEKQFLDKGDSGGGLFIKIGNDYYLIGIQSAVSETKSYFVMLSPYLSWIKFNL